MRTVPRHHLWTGAHCGSNLTGELAKAEIGSSSKISLAKVARPTRRILSKYQVGSPLGGPITAQTKRRRWSGCRSIHSHPADLAEPFKHARRVEIPLPNAAITRRFLRISTEEIEIHKPNGWAHRPLRVRMN